MSFISKRRFPDKEFVRHARSWQAADDLSEVLHHERIRSRQARSTVEFVLPLVFELELSFAGVQRVIRIDELPEGDLEERQSGEERRGMNRGSD